MVRSSALDDGILEKGAMASAIGEGWNVVWSESKQKGTAIWLGKVPGQPPLRFDPLPEGRKRRYFTKEEKRAVVDYAVEVRKSKSIGTCAKEIGITPILSEWVRAECATYRAFSSLDLDNRTLWVVDYRELLASLREGKTSICVSDYTEVGKSSGRLPISEGAGGPGLAIGEGEGTVWPANDYGGTAVWHDKLPGEPPLWFRPLSKEHGQRDYTETERCVIIDYVLEVRKTKSITTCAKEIGIGHTSVSRWVRWGCEAYRIFSCLHLDSRTLRAIDYRKLLADLRSGMESITISDYTGGVKVSTRKRTPGTRSERVPAQEEIRGGHPYFLSPGKGKRRVFTEEQKARVVDYLIDRFGGESFSACARACNLYKRTLIGWANERDSKRVCSDTTEWTENSLEEVVSDPVEDPLPDSTERKRYAKGGCGTATWLPKVPGGPPLRFPPVPRGGRRRFTERERNAIIDYVLEVRETKIIKECAEEMGLGAATVSYHVRAECKTNTIFLRLGLNDQDLRGVDYRKLLVDLRVGKSSIHITDYKRSRLPGTGPMGVEAKAYARDGHPYFASSDEGEERVFAEERREGVASYRFHELMEGSVLGDFREYNLDEQTLSDLFEDTYGCASKGFCPDATELPESSPETTGSDPDEDPFFGVPWQEVAEPYSTETPTEFPDSEFFFEK